MANNTRLNQNSTVGDDIATLDVGGVKHEQVIVEYLVGGVPQMVDAANPLPVTDNAAEVSLASIDLKLTNPLPVSGTVSTGGLTDAQLRATPVPVSGTLFGGAVTIADGADVAEGAVGDAVVAAGAAGTVSAKLRAISRDIVANIVLAAGNNNIGDVDVASIAAGSNIIGNVRIDQTTPGTTNAVQANAGTNLNTSLLALEAGGNLAAAATSLAIMDDWDESDRAKVNVIAGQVGIAGGTGTDGATVPRVTLATNVGLPAGSALLGKVGIDQTTPGTTNLVAIYVPTTIFNGKTTVTTAGTRVVLASSQAVKSVTIKALAANTGLIFVGNATVASTNGYQLSPGDSVSMDVADLNSVNIDSAVNAEGVSYIGIN